MLNSDDCLSNKLESSFISNSHIHHLSIHIVLGIDKSELELFHHGYISGGVEEFFFFFFFFLFFVANLLFC